MSNHTNTLQDGSVIDIENGRAFEFVGDPQCSDEVDNDEDGDVDFDGGPDEVDADADCDAETTGDMRPASEDDNEWRLPRTSSRRT